MKPEVPALDGPWFSPETGVPTPTTAKFFAGLVADPRAIAAVTPGASPWTYIASDDGFLHVAGGTVDSIALARAREKLVTVLTEGFVPMSKGDSVIVTFSDAPTLTFVPR